MIRKKNDFGKRNEIKWGNDVQWGVSESGIRQYELINRIPENRFKVESKK